MSRLGHYIAGLSVATVLSSTPSDANAYENHDSNVDEDKIEYIQELKDSLSVDSNLAWQLVEDNKKEIETTQSNDISRDELKDEIKQDVAFSYEAIEEVGKASRIKNLAYQNIINNSTFNTTGAYYDTVNNTITNVVNEWGDSNEVKDQAIIAHEAQHMHQYAKINFNADMSIEQHYKLHCYAEIGANIAGILQIREVYKEASDEERKDILDMAPDYYKNAVREGKINPLSDSVEDFDKEMSFIVNETCNYWMDEFGNAYDKQHLDFAISEKGDINYYDDELFDENYNEGVSMLLTMGGIDFSKYMNDDIKCYNRGIRGVEDEIRKGEKFDDIKSAIKKVRSNWGEVEYLEFEDDESLKGFSLSQRYELAVHKAFVDKISKTQLNDEKIDLIIKGDWENICGGFYKCLDDYVHDLPYFVNEGCFNKSKEFIDKLSKRNDVLGKASDKKFQKKLREIWTFEKSNGEKFCLYDYLDGKLPNLNRYVESCEVLNDKDARKKSEKIKDYMNDKFGFTKKEETSEEEGKVENNIDEVEREKKGIRDVKPQMAPDFSKLNSSNRSSVLYRNDIIHTGTDYLLKERQAKRLKENEAIIGNLREYYGKTSENALSVENNENQQGKQQQVNSVLKMQQNEISVR